MIVPSGVGVSYITPREVTGLDDTAAALEGACSRPIGSPPLRELACPGTKVLILVSDLTRGGGTKEVLPPLVDYLAQAGVARSDTHILVARGTHRKLTKEEKQFFRTGTLQGVAVEEHDCDDGAKLSALLLTQRGTPVRVNRRLKESDLVILVSAISFHYFAGFGGGRKLILPGCADRAGIVANHRLCLRDKKPVTLHPACRPSNIDDNPVHEDMCEALAAVKNVYAVNFFGDAGGRLIYLNFGDPVKSHVAACEVYAGIHRVPFGGLSDILILGCGGYPYDMNLLQAHKALRHGARSVRLGGAILFYARCDEGVGSESLAEALSQPRDKFLETAYTKYSINNQAAVSLLNLTENFRIAMVTDLDDKTLKMAKIERCKNAEAFIADAMESSGGDKIAVIPRGSHTLPFLPKE